MNTGPKFFIVDCEASGATPYSGELTEFAAIELVTGDSYYVRLWDTESHPDNPALPVIVEQTSQYNHREIFQDFTQWVEGFQGNPVFVSDNPAFDWMWIADGFDKHYGSNPFGYSARRIGDLAAGLSGNWRNTNKWKKWRKTTHDHNPLNDVKGNREALLHILEKYGQRIPGKDD